MVLLAAIFALSEHVTNTGAFRQAQVSADAGATSFKQLGRGDQAALHAANCVA
jgi:hypothetical protein